MMLPISCVLYFLKYISSYKFLTNEQWNSISKIIKNPKTSIKEKTIINKVIYNAYESYAIKKAYDFKNIHCYKCKNINIQDLIFSSKIGLYKSIIKYNGNNSFANFALIYIKSELYKLLTDSYSLSGVSKTHRKKNKSTFTRNELNNYKTQLTTEIIGYQDNWKFDKYYSTSDKALNIMIDKCKLNDKYNLLWQIINNKIDPFSKMIFTYKYNYYLEELTTNKKLANKMCCSEETIRNNLIKTKQIITQELISQVNI